MTRDLVLKPDKAVGIDWESHSRSFDRVAEAYETFRPGEAGDSDPVGRDFHWCSSRGERSNEGPWHAEACAGCCLLPAALGYPDYPREINHEAGPQPKCGARTTGSYRSNCQWYLLTLGQAEV